MVSIFHNNALGTTAGNTVVEDGATISAYSSSANLTIPENITISGSGQGDTFSTGAITHEGNASIDFDHTYSGTITLVGDTTITHVGDTSTNITINDLAGTGDVSFTPSVFGDQLILAGASPNTYIGTITVTGSFLTLAKNGAATGNIIVADGVMNAFLGIDGGLTDAIADTAIVVGQLVSSSNFSVDGGEAETIGGLSGDLNAFVGGTLTLDVTGTQTFDGSINGGGTVVKTGVGTQILTGSCGVSTNISVLAGTLVLNSPFTTSSCDVTIDGGTLKGDGTLDDVIGTSGKFNAGTSPGTMNITGAFTLSSGMTFEEEIAGPTAGTQYDQTIVTGAVALGGATLNILPTYTPSAGTVFTIITGASVSGTFAGLADGATITVSGLTFRVNYTATTVTLTYVSGTLADTGSPIAAILIVSTMILIGTGGIIIRRRKFISF